ncbi:helix-turn-helix transcriptional regulator [Kangiella koreensis]|uniref:Putative plasmid maintenance system antidote protein, XRE family n=1 Tax=Kangiella koreensis (strain DSM 16069 / JCM 12317 / KCTC 12182 / SW-125) TaxID=523791 RepID=C7R654_KANKD|nr:XRE family transcriptional regulator [Kangiella koreensis]ACV25485.1 putative plasmid maintenance system antidote protein, XRE family [Kangiella koreensis DSM 16069]
MAIVRSNILPVKHPGIVFKEKCMNAYNHTDLSKRLNMTRKELQSFTDGISSVTIELAKGLEQITGISLEYWMSRQKKYDAYKGDIK